MKKLYGWKDNDKSDFDFLMIEMTEKDFKDKFILAPIDDMTQEVHPKKVVDQAYGIGRWFLNLNEAKKALLDDLLGEIRWRETAIKKIHQTNAESFTNLVDL